MNKSFYIKETDYGWFTAGRAYPIVREVDDGFYVKDDDGDEAWISGNNGHVVDEDNATSLFIVEDVENCSFEHFPDEASAHKAAKDFSPARVYKLVGVSEVTIRSI